MIGKDKLCILIDDDDDDQLIFSSTVRKHFPSYELKAFSSFEDAKPLLNNNHDKVGAIFIDLNMPKLNGKEGLRILRSDPHFESTPLIIYSTSNNPEDVNECLKVGATAFITKPSRIEALVDELSNYLRV
jgi:CheY-like chemotaxis protein